MTTPTMTARELVDRLRAHSLPPPKTPREALGAVFAADESPTGVTVEELARHTRRLADEHEQALTTLTRVLAVLGEPSETEHEVTR